jgi:hypothetical protein
MSDLSSRYSDLLDGSDDPAFAHFLARVEEAHQIEPPSAAQRLPSGEGSATTPPLSGGEGMRHSLRRAPALRATQIRWRSTGTRLGILLALVALISTGAVLAATTIFNLGKPTNAVSPNQYFPLSGFRYVKGLQPPGKARVLFIGVLTPSPSNPSERWPIVKALEQFGTFSGLKPVERICFPITEAKRDICSPPTFDWSHATYRSRYVRFEERELLRATKTQGAFKPYQRMNGEQLAIYRRFVRVPINLRDKFDPYNADMAEYTQKLPVVVTGNYVEGPSPIVLDGDFDEQLPPGGPPPTPASGFTAAPSYPSGLSFAQIEHALQTQTDPKDTKLVEDVNAEANVITAIICRTDGLRPSSVCGRPIIQQILRRLK